MNKHTPGPWSVVQHDHAICVQTESPNKTQFGASRYAAIGGFDRNDQDQLQEALANAHLIAAAPDLLEALQAIMSETNPIELAAALDMARAAIAKATEAKP